MALLLAAGCATSGDRAAQTPRFREASSANVILKFAGWDYTFLVKPAHFENGFMEPVRRETLGGILDRLQVRRDLAVVVVGAMLEADELRRVASEWKAILSDCGFGRVVIVRAQMGGELNGSIVVDDSQISGIQRPGAA